MQHLCCKTYVVAHVAIFAYTLYTQYEFGEYSVPKPNNPVNPKPQKGASFVLVELFSYASESAAGCLALI